MKFVKFFLMLLILNLGLFSCGERRGLSQVTIKGSDTMVILGQRWAEDYMKKDKDVIVQITGGGTGTGIAALINNATDICQASRKIKKEEKDMAEKRNKRKVEEIKVAVDGIAIYVHKENKLEEISTDKLRNIYTGKIKNWKELGGENKEIIPYSRENNSGTYVYFKEHILDNKDFVDNCQTLPGTAAIINGVSKDKYSIGYGGIAYAKGVKIIKVKNSENEISYLPSVLNVTSGRYPISRYLYFYIYENPKPEVKKFIDYVLSQVGQNVCEEVGYYPLSK